MKPKILHCSISIDYLAKATCQLDATLTTTKIDNWELVFLSSKFGVRFPKLTALTKYLMTFEELSSVA